MKKKNFSKIKKEDISPSQFYINKDKMKEVSSFINTEDDVKIPVAKIAGKVISLDGHTRLAVAISKGFKKVLVYEDDFSEYIMDFVNEAKKRGILTPYDMIHLNNEEYIEKWYKFCDDYFENNMINRYN